MSDKIITLMGDSWKMTINLVAVPRELDLRKVERFCKLLAQYADPKDFDDITEAFEVGHKRLKKAWKEAMEKYG